MSYFLYVSMSLCAMKLPTFDKAAYKNSTWPRLCVCVCMFVWVIVCLFGCGGISVFLCLCWWLCVCVCPPLKGLHTRTPCDLVCVCMFVYVIVCFCVCMCVCVIMCMYIIMCLLMLVGVSKLPTLDRALYKNSMWPHLCMCVWLFVCVCLNFVVSVFWLLLDCLYCIVFMCSVVGILRVIYCVFMCFYKCGWQPQPLVSWPVWKSLKLSEGCIFQSWKKVTSL